MNQDFYQKLVDLYAGDDLSAELMEELGQAAATRPHLAEDMRTLRMTVELLRSLPAPSYSPLTEENILERMAAEGVNLRKSATSETAAQYLLPFSLT